MKRVNKLHATFLLTAISSIITIQETEARVTNSRPVVPSAKLTNSRAVVPSAYQQANKPVVPSAKLKPVVPSAKLKPVVPSAREEAKINY